MAAPPPLRADEVLRVLRTLAPVTADPSVVLVGGQAVEFWARFLGLDTAESSAELLASKDIDFEGSADAARAAADLLAVSRTSRLSSPSGATRKSILRSMPLLSSKNTTPVSGVW